MFLRKVFLCFLGLSAGGIVAAGVFAFLVIIGIFPRLLGVTHTKKHIMLYETLIILGGVLGNISDIYELPFGFGGNVLLGIYGLSAGIFVGCLVMSLAETVKAFPVFSRRINLGVGIQYIVLALGLGKLTGSLVFFAEKMGK